MALLRSMSTVAEEYPTVTTVIAINGDKNSQLAVKWAVDNLLSHRAAHCTLIHVRNQGLHPHHDNVPEEGRTPTVSELQQFFLPYRGFCVRKGIAAKEVILHDLDVASALVDYVANNSISNIVVGASNQNAITRKFKDSDVPSSLLKSVPQSCAVYVISKGKVQTKRPEIRSQTPKSNAAAPQNSSRLAQLHSHLHDASDSEDINRSNFSHGSSKSSGSDRISFDKTSDFKQIIPHRTYRSGDSFTSENSSHQNSQSGSSDISGPLSVQSNGSDTLDFLMNLEDSRNSFNSQTPCGLDAEMRRLRLELKQTMDMYTSVCKEAVEAKHRVWELQKWKTAEERKLEEAKLAEEAALSLAEMERQKSKAAAETARMAQRLADMEIKKRKIAEMKAMQEAEEKKRAMEAFTQKKVLYRRYTIEEIEAATDYFKSSNKIGEGGYGPVYKAILDHTPVAIKVLRPDFSQGKMQFQHELQVLSSIRHPHMVILVGACPEYGCLVYEYLENGSLEDRIFRKNNTPPIPWRIRFKIAAEITSALLFLHQTKPEPLVHRDLKPANILLDRNYVSKISDVGLARLIPESLADSVSEYRMTAAAGTFCYIDPEYQKTGMLSVKSDIYSLGVMLLQIITAKPAMGLSHQVGEAIENGTFVEMLDPAVKDWPVEEALSFAKLALKCCELRRRDRPDLSSVIMPELNRLSDLGTNNEARDNDSVFFPHSTYMFLPPLGPTETVSQINAKRRWWRLESMTKIRSFKNSFRKASSSQSGKLYGKSSKKHVEGCWSFVSNCSFKSHASLRKFKSFST